MRIFYSILLFLCFNLGASAQIVHFVYLESEQGNPFYVKMDDRISSSSGTGYFILSNLTDSTYNFAIGFPSIHTESRFTITMKGRDLGYLIRQAGDGLELFDLQTSAIIKAKPDEYKKTSYRKIDDDFAVLLSRASNDSSLLYVPVYIKQEEVVKNSGQAEVDKEGQEEHPSLHGSGGFNQDSMLSGPVIVPEQQQQTDSVNTADVPAIRVEDKVDSSVSVKNEIAKDTTQTVVAAPHTIYDSSALIADSTSVNGIVRTKGTSPEEKQVVSDPGSPVSGEIIQADSLVLKDNQPVSFKRSHIVKHAESSTSEGFGLIYYDQQDGITDTIRLVIPNPRYVIGQAETETEKVDAGKDPLQADTAQKEHEVQNKANEIEYKHVIAVEVKAEKPKSGCRSLASSGDYFKLRINMASRSDDQSMMAAAAKYFKSKCFTTEQIKNLSSLFLTPESKYQFFEMAHSHISDIEQFSSLASEIKDEYYFEKFKHLAAAPL